jgi:hypothetical protein
VKSKRGATSSTDGTSKVQDLPDAVFLERAGEPRQIGDVALHDLALFLDVTHDRVLVLTS